MKALEKYPFHSYGLIDAPKILADIVESTIGAIYVDSNSSIDTTWEVFSFSFFFFLFLFILYLVMMKFFVLWIINLGG